MNSIYEDDGKQSAGFTMAVVGTILWSTTAIFIRTLTEDYSMPPLVLALWREVGVAVGLVIALLVINRRLLHVPRQHWAFLTGYAGILMFFNSTWTISVALNGAAVSTVLIYSSPAFTALVSWWIWKEKLDFRKGAAVLLSLFGCVLVSGAYDPALWKLNPIGVVLGLLSGLLFAAYSIMGKAAVRRGLNPWSAMACTFSAAPFFLLILLMLPFGAWLNVEVGTAGDLLWLGGDWGGWALVALLAFGPTIGGYGLYNMSLRSLPASTANLIASSEPVFTTLLAYMLLGERLLSFQIWGAVFIMAGVFLLRRNPESMTTRFPPAQE